MKTTTSKTIVAIYIAFLSIPAFGQDIENAYRKAVDGIFSGIPAEKITTGILIERAPSFVNMYRYEGACKEKDTCNVRKWKQMYSAQRSVQKMSSLGVASFAIAVRLNHKSLSII